MTMRVWTDPRDGRRWLVEEGTNEIWVAGGPPPPRGEISPLLRFFPAEGEGQRVTTLWEGGELEALGDDDLGHLLDRAREAVAGS